GRADGAGDDVFRNGVGGNRDERHGGGRVGGGRWKKKGRGGEKSAIPPLFNAAFPFSLSSTRRPLPAFRDRIIEAGHIKRGPNGGRVSETVAQWRTTHMRTYDLTPFYRSTVGFDRLFSLLDQVNSDGGNGYPPYNIERTGENAYRISVAVSGFAK